MREKINNGARLRRFAMAEESRAGHALPLPNLSASGL